MKVKGLLLELRGIEGRVDNAYLLSSPGLRGMVGGDGCRRSRCGTGRCVLTTSEIAGLDRL